MRDVKSTLLLRRCLPEKPTELGAKKFVAWSLVWINSFATVPISALEVAMEGGIHGGRNVNKVINNYVHSSLKISRHQ